MVWFSCDCLATCLYDMLCNSLLGFSGLLTVTCMEYLLWKCMSDSPLISKVRPGGPCMNHGSMRSGHTTGTMPCMEYILYNITT